MGNQERKVSLSIKMKIFTWNVQFGWIFYSLSWKEMPKMTLSSSKSRVSKLLLFPINLFNIVNSWQLTNLIIFILFIWCSIHFQLQVIDGTFQWYFDNCCWRWSTTHNMALYWSKKSLISVPIFSSRSLEKYLPHMNQNYPLNSQ